MLSTKDGDVTRLEVKAVGKPMPKGKWLKHGEEIVPSEEFTIENFEDGTSILTISEVYPDDTGDIVYEAYNPLGVAATTTHLVVETTEGKQCSKRKALTFLFFSHLFDLFPITLHIFTLLSTALHSAPHTHEPTLDLHFSVFPQVSWAPRNTGNQNG